MTSPGVTETLRLPSWGLDEQELPAMCLNCGCMRAHDDMGKPDINITYEDLKRAAAGNDMTVEATLAMIVRTGEQDRREHPGEYPATPPVAAPGGDKAS